VTVSGAHPGAPLVPGLLHTWRAGEEKFPSALPSWARAFPGAAEQAGAARRFVAGLLVGSPFRDDAVVVLSELYTNALLHTASGKPGGLVVVQVSRWRHGVRIAVTDQGSPSQPVIRDPAACGEPAETGNGLYLAAHLARRLDWHDDASGRTIAAIFGQLPPQHHPGSQPLCPGTYPGFRTPG
jgi:serine/threonine-protein kinase RsbW